jgi:thioredoxin reductase (NADPH)
VLTAENVADLVIIGAGPTGLFAAFYAGLRGLRVTVIEALPQPGGQLTAIYPEKVIYDVPGFPQILARDLVHRLVDQAARFSPTFCLGERALRLRRAAEGFWVVETDRAVHRARAVLIAAGLGAFQPVRLGNPAVDQYEGRGVFYTVGLPASFQPSRALVVGGGDTAVDWALTLRQRGTQVLLIHRRDQFRAYPGSVAALQRSSVEIRLWHVLKAVQAGPEDRVQAAVIADTRTGQETVVAVEAIFLCLGFKADLGPLRTWGLETVGTRHLRVTPRMETNLPGVYAAGDIAAPEGVEPLPLIVTGFAQATTAVNHAAVFLNPQARVFPGHASERRGGLAGESEAAGPQ